MHRKAHIYTYVYAYYIAKDITLTNLPLYTYIHLPLHACLRISNHKKPFHCIGQFEKC